MEQELLSIKEKIEGLIKELKPESKEKSDVLLVLITRKGYGLLKIVMKSDLKLEPILKDSDLPHVGNSGLPYVSDRYILKLAKPENMVKGKTVYIFDDTITNGNNMFYYYCMFMKKGASRVIPIVYAASIEFLAKRARNHRERKKGNSEYIEIEKWIEYERIFRDEPKQEDFQKVLDGFYNTFVHKIVLSADKIAGFSIQETLWFQENLFPMVMDLPVFRYEEAGRTNETKKEIILSRDEFKHICTSTYRWQFVNNSYNELEQEIRCDFFQLNDELLYRQFHNLFFNFVVKCKYKECDQGIKAIFIPFAIIKSGSIMDIWSCFCNLLRGTEYFQQVVEHVKPGFRNDEMPDDDYVLDELKQNHNMCRGVFRAVVFSLSNYIGYLFQEKLLEETGKKISLDEYYLREHSENTFAKTFKNEYSGFDKDEYIKKIAAIKNIDFQAVPVLNECILEKENASEHKVELCVREYVLARQSENGPRKKKIATIEELEKELDRKFRFESEEQKRLYLTKALILLLELSCMGNEIVVSNEDNRIYRGFRTGENGKILMPKGLKWIYPYYYALYYEQDSSFFVENYESFKQWIRNLFYSQEYVDNLISKENLEFYLNYFEEVKENNLHEQILNKAYILRDYWEGNVTSERKIFVEQAFSRVKEWGDKIRAAGVDQFDYSTI